MRPIQLHPVSLLVGVAFVFSLGLMQAPKSSVLHVPTLTPEQEEILSHLSIVYRNNGQFGTNKTIRFSGVDVQIVNGLGATNGNPGDPDSVTTGVVNGVGNLIVGYNEEGNPFQPFRTGSHNLIVGHGNSYDGYGCVLAGRDHYSDAVYTGTLGGWRNRPRGNYATVTGGRNNVASGQESSIAGGSGNFASAQFAAVLGGASCAATGVNATVSGGNSNTAGGPWSSVSGGQQNQANGDASSVSGGAQNQASWSFTSILGGNLNLATDSHATVGGGNQNQADGLWSVVSGGNGRIASGTSDWVAGTLFQDQ
jgi:hypothetical protein